jgi:hypothetical protein
MEAGWRIAALVLLAGLLAGCDKPRAPEWMRITPEGAAEGGVFYLDRANLSVNSGTPYVILQTRYPDGRTGSIRAEANCAGRKLEPTALKEALYGTDGVPVGNGMTTVSAADEKAILEVACSRR